MIAKRITNPVLRTIWEWASAALLAFLLFLFLRHFVFRVADVNGNSMEPTLSHGDFVLLSRVGYWFGEPERGDIVAFPYRQNPSQYFYIKRVVGLPGDVVDLQNNRFTVNGEEFAFGYDEAVTPGDVLFPLTVDEGVFFVLGDNRGLSKDSRYESVGLIAKNEMLGRVVFRLWPPGRMGPLP